MKKNIIWVVLDSIRGDRTPFGDSERNTMPNLYELGSGSNRIGTTCISHGIWSQPSVASMMTGLWPLTHGMGIHNDVLPSEIQTVAERLSTAGYQTVGLSTNPYFSRETGLDRGFDTFQYFSIEELVKAVGVRGLTSFLRNVRRYSGGFTLDKRKHSPDYLFNEIVKNRIKTASKGDNPFALIAHYHGAHHPYYPSPQFNNVFKDETGYSPKRTAEIAYKYTTDPYRTIASAESITDSEWMAIRTAYDCLVFQIDALLGELIECIKYNNLQENSIIVFTSDHGDLLGEYNLVSHKLVLHDSLINVPLVVVGSDNVAQFENHCIQHIDIMQTILEEVGISTDGMQGITNAEEPRDFAISQRGAKTAKKTLNRIGDDNTEMNTDIIQSGNISCIITNNWKLIASGNGYQLYHIQDESKDVSNEYPEHVEELSTRLEQWKQKYEDPYYTQETAEFDENVQQRLSDLGYIND